MKARIKKTGEIIEILGISNEYGTVTYIDYLNNLRHANFSDGVIELIDDYESAQKSPIDWEQRRYELAKEAMGAFIASPNYQFYSNREYYEGSIATAEYIAKGAVNYADALIAELRKPNSDS